MLILTLRTDKPEAEIGLFGDDKQLHYDVWYAHRELSTTIHQKILDVLHEEKKELRDLQGIVAFIGPGSFTGLRIGLTVANALADGLGIPIVGCKGDSWSTAGITQLLDGKGAKRVMPEYGAPAHITTQRK